MRSPLVVPLCHLGPLFWRALLGQDNPDELPWAIGTTVASELFSEPVLQGSLSHMTGIYQHADEMWSREQPLRLGFHDFEAMV
jgi:hypothetical protein